MLEMPDSGRGSDGRGVPEGSGIRVRRASEGLAAAIHPTGDRLIQDSYSRRWGVIVVNGANEVRIPYRHYQEPMGNLPDPTAELVREAWLTRSSDGRVRQRALRALLEDPAPWAVPFMVQLSAEYVIEIGHDLAEYVAASLPTQPRMIEAFRQFWRDNPQFVSLTYARATSYWSEYYHQIPRGDYPSLVALNQIQHLVRSAN